MEIDLASAGAVLRPDPGVMRAEVCIVGGGIAGLVLADRLVSFGVDVVLLEAGGRRPAPELAREVELSGEAHIGSRADRPEVLGGSSLVWGGQMLPMLPGETWPVPTRALEAFYADVQKLVGVDALPFEADAFLQVAGQPRAPELGQVPRTVARMSKFAPFAARNLGASLGGRLRASAQGRVVLGARVTGLYMGTGGRVRAVAMRTPGGGELLVEATAVVLAAGTVETCRLLLVSRRREGAEAERGVGNQHGQVGRGFQDHLTVAVARLSGRTREHAVALLRPWIVGGLRGTMHGWKLEADAGLRRRLRMNAVLAHVTFEEPEGTGMAAVRAMLRARQRGEPRSGIEWRSLPGAFLDTWRLRRDVRGSGRRYIAPEVRVGLRINVAQETLGRSWVGLADRLDEFEQPLARVHWEHAPADLRTVRVFATYLQKRMGWLGSDGLQWNPDALPIPRMAGLAGRLPGTAWDRGLDRPLPGVEDARHAMGGVRMGTDPRTSVVDLNLKVHGVANLYVASAAVFPDGCPQLPTMTLMALTLRLAEHLRIQLKMEPARGR